MRLAGRFDRLVVTEVSVPAALGFVTYTFLLMMRALFGLIEQVFVQGISFRAAGELLLMGIPHVAVLTIPMSFLFGVLIGMGRMTTDNEIIALQAAGVSYRRLLLPVLFLGASMAAVNGYLTLKVMPDSNRRLSDMKTELFASAKNLGRIEPRVFHEDFPNMLLYVRDVEEATGYWRDVLIFDRSRPGEERLTIARRGRLLTENSGEQEIPGEVGEPLADGGDPWLLLEDVVTHEFEPRRPEAYSVAVNRSQLHKIPVQSEQQMTRYIPGVRERGTDELLRFLTGPERRGGRASEKTLLELRMAEVEIHKRLAIPAACMVFALLAVPLGVGSRSGGKGRGFVLSIFVILVYYVMFNNGELFALEGKIAPWMGLWMPNLVLTAVGLVMVGRMSRWLGERQPGVSWLRQWQEWRMSRRSRRLTSGGQRPLTGSIPLRLQRKRYVARFPTLLDRYVTRRMLAPLLLVLLSTAGLYIVIDLTDRVDEIGKNDVPADVVVAYYWNLIPQVVLDVTPFGLMIAVLILLTILERQKELTAIKAAGLSLYRLMVPVLFMAAAGSAGLWFLEESVVPRANRDAKRLLDRIQGRETTRSYQATDRQWLMSRDGSSLYNFLRYDVESMQMIRFTLYRFDEDRQLRLHLFADAVRWDNGSWLAEEGWFRQIYPDSADEYREITQALEVAIPESPLYFGQEHRLPAEMSFRELTIYIATLVDSGYRPVRLMVRRHQKLTYPLAAFVMVFLALPFGLNRGGRKVTTMQGIAVALGLGIGYFVMVAVFGKMGEANLLPPVVGAWGPIILAGLFAINRLTTLRT